MKAPSEQVKAAAIQAAAIVVAAEPHAAEGDMPSIIGKRIALLAYATCVSFYDLEKRLKYLGPLPENAG